MHLYLPPELQPPVLGFLLMTYHDAKRNPRITSAHAEVMNRPQFVEIGCITVIGVGVCQQSIGLGQVVFTLCPIVSG